jgi:hypothetical protein
MMLSLNKVSVWHVRREVSMLIEGRFPVAGTTEQTIAAMSSDGGKLCAVHAYKGTAPSNIDVDCVYAFLLWDVSVDDCLVKCYEEDVDFETSTVTGSV